MKRLIGVVSWRADKEDGYLVDGMEGTGIRQRRVIVGTRVLEEVLRCNG